MVKIASGQPLSILHLEDLHEDHTLVKRILHRADLQCVLKHTDSLEEFRALVEHQSFDIILADYRLHGFTALDAWYSVAALECPPPFILLSDAIGEAAAVDAIRLGMSDYLLKDDIARLPHVMGRAIEVHKARRERELAINELAVSQNRLAELTEHLQTSIELERASIAREIHDDIGGALAAVRFDIAWISRNTSDANIKDHASAASDMLQHAIGASQRIMMNLRPPILEQGLVEAIQWLARGFERRTGVSVIVNNSSDKIMVTDDIQLVAYRTAQEALTNVAKYANPTNVRIDLSDREHFLTLEVADNGCGIQQSSLDKPKAFGLKGLNERARTVGGWLDISSEPGHGTCITLLVPLSSTPEVNNGDPW